MFTGRDAKTQQFADWFEKQRQPQGLEGQQVDDQGKAMTANPMGGVSPAQGQTAAMAQRPPLVLGQKQQQGPAAKQGQGGRMPGQAQGAKPFGGTPGISSRSEGFTPPGGIPGRNDAAGGAFTALQGAQGKAMQGAGSQLASMPGQGRNPMRGRMPGQAQGMGNVSQMLQQKYGKAPKQGG
jgi:hypothetical protein